jgi:hypothetical protein
MDKSALKYDDEPNSFYTASLDEVIETLHNAAADIGNCHL